MQHAVDRIFIRAFHCGFDNGWRRQILPAVDIELSQSLQVAPVFPGAGNDEDGVGGGIDNRRAQDPDVSDNIQVIATGNIDNGHGRDAGEFIG